MPSRSAAPPSPRTRHFARSSIATMWSRSMSTSAVFECSATRGSRQRRELDRQARSRGNNHGSLDDVAQLTDVSWPRIALQREHAVFRHGLDRLAERLAELVHEAPHEHGNVIRTLAEWRNTNRKHIQTVIEVLAERALRDALLQITVRRRHDANVHVDRLSSFRGARSAAPGGHAAA